MNRFIPALLVVMLLFFVACKHEQYFPFGKSMRRLYPYNMVDCEQTIYGKKGIESKTFFNKYSADSSFWIGYYPNHRVKFRYDFLIDTTVDTHSISGSNCHFTWFSFSGYEYFPDGNKKCFRQICYGRKCGEWVWYMPDGTIMKKVNYGPFKR